MKTLYSFDRNAAPKAGEVYAFRGRHLVVAKEDHPKWDVQPIFVPGDGLETAPDPTPAIPPEQTRAIDGNRMNEVMQAALRGESAPQVDPEPEGRVCGTCGSPDPAEVYEECDDGSWEPSSPMLPNVNPCPDDFHPAPDKRGEGDGAG